MIRQAVYREIAKMKVDTDDAMIKSSGSFLTFEIMKQSAKLQSQDCKPKENEIRCYASECKFPIVRS